MAQGHCEKCEKTVLGSRRWIFTATCADTTGSRYISFFDDQAVSMLGGAPYLESHAEHQSNDPIEDTVSAALRGASRAPG